VLVVGGCHEKSRQDSDIQPESNLRITFGGFIDGGDENERIEGVCRPDVSRTSLSCDMHNGLSRWRVTELVFRIARSPYSEQDARDIRTQVTISPMSTESVIVKLGMRLPEDEVLGGRVLSHWSWLVVGASAVPV
jgi:hypothetical protein